MINLSKEEYLKKAKDYAISRGGVCLSEEYVDNSVKMYWRCSKIEHSEWCSSYDHIVGRMQWCRKCYKDRSIVENAYDIAMKYAKSHNGFVIIPNGVVKKSTLLTWKCENLSHNVWKDSLSNVLNDKWCKWCKSDRTPRERPSKKEKLKKAQEYAKNREGICLSETYQDQYIKLEFKCKEPQHPSFFNCFPQIKRNNYWCKKCKYESIEEKQKRISILGKAIAYAKQKKGKCLSTEYFNAKDKLIWKCDIESHNEWFVSYNSIINKTWCPECAGNIAYKPEELIEKAKEYANSRSGFCVSSECSTPKDKLLWKCSDNSHDIWEVSYSMISKKSWCPECGLNSTAKKRKLVDGLERAKYLAEKKGGVYLSNNYIDSHAKMLWKCSSKDHSAWRASYATIKKGNWCPECANFIFYKENRIRTILNSILDTKFIKCKPKWNINPKTNRLLELDGYSEQRKIAFEFQGLQHYKRLYNMTEEQFEKLKYRDEIKKEHCRNNNIKLIIIDDSKELDNDVMLYDYTIKCLKNLNINPIKYLSLLDFNKIFNSMSDYQKDALEKAQNYASSRGGVCLSTTYKNYSSELKWKCSFDEHSIWNGSMRIVYNKSWCKECGIIEQWKKRKSK